MTADAFPLVATSSAPMRADDRPQTFLGLDAAELPSADVASRTLARWVRDYLMRPHAALGRPGHVCPFTAQAIRLNLLRLGISPLRGTEKAEILRTMQAALAVFDELPCTRSNRIFRTVIVGFPACADPAGLATLRQVQNALRHHSIVRAKMVGLFEPDSPAEGLLNPDFRPLRSPIPALAIRMLVEHDAPFVVRNPLLLPVYLAKFPLTGARRLVKSGLLTQIGKRLFRKRPRETAPTSARP